MLISAVLKGHISVLSQLGQNSYFLLISLLRLFLETDDVVFLTTPSVSEFNQSLTGIQTAIFPGSLSPDTIAFFDPFFTKAFTNAIKSLNL